MNKTIKRALLYCRVSKDEQAREGLSLDVQEEKLRAYCEDQGLQVVAVLREDYTSTVLDRPELNLAFGMADQGEFDVLLVRRTDRLSREPNHLGWLHTEFEKRGVSIVDLETADIPEDSRSIVQAVYGTSAKRENTVRVQRTIEGTERAAKVAGRLPSGGSRLYGFHYIPRHRDAGGNIIPGYRRIDHEEAAVVKKMVRWVLQGESLRGIGKRLEGKGIYTGEGKSWSGTTIKRLLTNPALCGKPRAYRFSRRRDALDLPGEHPAIISPEEWERVQRTLERRPRPTKPRAYPLVGLVWCQCGQKAVGSRGPKYRYYRCASKKGGHGRAHARSLEWKTYSKLFELLSNPQMLIRQIADRMDDDLDPREWWKARATEIQQRVAELRNRERRLLRERERGKFSRDVVDERLEELATEAEAVYRELQEALARLKELIELKAAEEHVAEWLPRLLKRYVKGVVKLPLEDKRRLLEALKIRVTLRPGSDPVVEGSIPTRVLEFLPAPGSPVLPGHGGLRAPPAGRGREPA